jgi:P-type Cu+ transporter
MSVALVTDPVCGMELEPSQAVAQSHYQGTVYYFCSRECKERFEAEPERYVGQGPLAPPLTI